MLHNMYFVNNNCFQHKSYQDSRVHAMACVRSRGVNRYSDIKQAHRLTTLITSVLGWLPTCYCCSTHSDNGMVASSCTPDKFSGTDYHRLLQSKYIHFSARCAYEGDYLTKTSEPK